MKSLSILPVVLFLGAGFTPARIAAAQSFSFVTVDVPCEACPGGIARRTSVGGINPDGDIVGAYTDAVGKQNGFLLSDGRFTTIDVPGSLAGATGILPTVARGIGLSGDIVGQYTAPVSSAPLGSPDYCPAVGSTACIKGFLYRHGKFSTVLFPGHPGAIVAAITPAGDMYGCYHDFDVMGSMFSAAWTRSGDVSIAAGGGELTDPSASYPVSMHTGVTPDGRTVVGFYGTHGYILENGILRRYDVPNSISTSVFDITPAGHEIVGAYVDSGGKNHGFLQLPNQSSPITIDVPSTPPFNAVGTIIYGVNPDGVIVGNYTDSGGHTHGFFGVPAEHEDNSDR
ncbi:MAG TPA: hypothetical protein VEV19_00645 [Ktedonobacteraceae bacterium]|nr:hypothetical protein [Ktedonobacteraceae bacterium]